MSSNAQVYFLINPRSGGKRFAPLIAALRGLAQKGESAIEYGELTAADSQAHIARALQADTVVIGGGDGTISSLLPLFKQHPRIGILPLGTGNDLARELKLKKLLFLRDPQNLIDFYRESTPQQFSLCKLEYGPDFSQNTHFINYVSFGFDAKVVADFARYREHAVWKALRGVWTNRFVYGLASCANLGAKLPEAISILDVESKMDQAISNCKSILFANIRAIMGLGISNRTGTASDDKIECVVVRSVWAYLSMMLNHRVPLIQPFFAGSSTCWEMSRLSEHVHVQIDGEPRPDIASTQFRISSGDKVNLLVDERYQAPNVL